MVWPSRFAIRHLLRSKPRITSPCSSRNSASDLFWILNLLTRHAPVHLMTNMHKMNRRQFISRTSAVGLLTITSGVYSPAAAFHGRIRKAMIIGEVTEKALEPLKAAGFQGVETTHICPEEEAGKGRAVAEKLGMRVHSVLRGWMEFNSDDPKKVEDSLESTRKALRAAKAYGADAILLVPCRVGGLPMPEPWEFAIAFDEKTGHVTRVVVGDNARFESYIKAQNQATDASRAAVGKLIPLAEELK